jgi:hypothetical protein
MLNPKPNQLPPDVNVAKATHLIKKYHLKKMGLGCFGWAEPTQNIPLPPFC